MLEHIRLKCVLLSYFHDSCTKISFSGEIFCAHSYASGIFGKVNIFTQLISSYLLVCYFTFKGSTFGQHVNLLYPPSLGFSHSQQLYYYSHE